MDSARILKAVLSQETAVNCAAEFGHAETVKISGENGVDLNARDVWQGTALDVAQREDVRSFLSIIVAKKANQKRIED
ncbi:unnamed protein product [Enterobius vermicularis]|uniref:ANK_REP_REGION domain-containing protein n=1 Tax=Enterobius vermicularis TaxID=51028 RepID=A0A0N4VAB9_ENTVE|nr:unnamed protein product [Enterobius vermicularis]